jgi:hypothetical protein
MSDDIVDRLRQHVVTSGAAWDASDEIIRLRAEVERLTALTLTQRDEYDELLDLYVLRRRKHNEAAALADQLAEAGKLADPALRAYPLQAFKDPRTQKGRAVALDAVRNALAAYEAAHKEGQ